MDDHLPSGSFLGIVAGIRSLGRVQLSDARYAGGTSLPPHAHASAYLSFVVAGRYTEVVGRRTIDCPAHTVRFHPRGEEHADLFSHEGATCFNIELIGDWSDSLAEIGAVPERPLATDRASWLALTAWREWQRPDSASALVMEEAAIGLLSACAERAKEIDAAASSRPLERAMEHIEEHLAGRLTLSAVATAAGVHETHLARVFRQRLGCTIGEYVRHRRVVRAQRALRERPGLPLSRIAADTGFADHAHLTRTFVRIVGVTPREFRHTI